MTTPLLPHIGLSEKLLYAYLAGEHDASEDFSSRLSDGYKYLMGDGRIEERENVYPDRYTKKVRLV